LATQYHHLSDYDPASIPDASGMKVGIIVAEWNQDITSRLLDGARETLLKNGVLPENIIQRWVPGSFELVYGAGLLASLTGVHAVDGIIVLGSVIRGETPHFDYICSGVSEGISVLNAKGEIPVIFGLLTTNTKQQALDRAGGVLGNKGDEAAVTVIKMIAFRQGLR